MATDQALGRHLVELLDGGNAHVTFDEATADIPPSLRGARPERLPHSPWRLLEHLRIAQWDILEFSRNAKHVSPEFPDGYWPKKPAPADATAWTKSVQSFRADLKAMVALAENESVDLLARIPHGEGQTILREVMVLADHNAYHLGELLLLRRLLGAWK